jgi:hypothetical protein
MLLARHSGLVGHRFRLPRSLSPFLVVLLVAGCGLAEADAETSDTFTGLEAGGREAAASAADAEPVADPRCEDELDYEACGGDLEGTWKVDHACGDYRIEVDRLFGDMVAFACWIPAELIREVRGTVAYEDGVERTDVTLRSRSRYTIPDTCAAALAPELSPAAFCEAFAARLPAGGRTGGCVSGEGGCVCDYREDRRLRESRPYRLDGEAVEFPGDDAAGFTYCVGGGRLVQSRDDMFLHLGR